MIDHHAEHEFRYIFHLKPGRYVIVISAAPINPKDEPTQFLLRCIGENIEVNHFEDHN